VKLVTIIAITVIFGIGIGFSVNVSAEESLIPSWIKNIAGFWVDGQISDAEFISSLQFLVEKGLLTIPDKNTLENIIPKETTSNPTISTTTLSEFTPNLVALSIIETGLGKDKMSLLVNILDVNGNPRKNIVGEIRFEIFNFDDQERYDRKAYVDANSFVPYTNRLTGEETIGFEYTIQNGKMKRGGLDRDLAYFNGLGTLVMSLDMKGKVYSNTILLDHLPIEEGYLREDTGFIKNIEIGKNLDIGNFLVKVTDVGPYIGEDLNDNKKLKKYFKVNLNTKSSDVSGVEFTLDESYLVDDQKNRYILDPISSLNFENAFLGESYEYQGGNGFLLFEEVPENISQLKFILKVSRIHTDDSQTQFSDEITFSLK
jgi:hypothetical protein